MVRVLPPPPIQGIGFAAGFTMQVEMRDNSYDFVKLGNIVDTIAGECRARNRRCGWC